MQLNRSPKQHREEVELWRATAPRNDSDIFHDGWNSSWQDGSPRHSKIAEQLAPLLQWMRRPEGLLPGEEKPTSDISTSNWSIVPDNDNQPPRGYRDEAGVEIVPSLEAIEREMVKDVIYNEAGKVVSIGSLRFSDGSQYEKETVWNGVDVINADRRKPVGAMLGTKEKPARIEGVGVDPVELSASNRHFNEMFKVKPRSYQSGKRKKKKGRNYTAAESTAILKKAWQNTDPSKVTYTKCPDGLPMGTQRISDNFLGMKKSTCSGGGSQAWEDICTAMVNREIWAQTIAEMPKEHIDTLEIAGYSHTFSELGKRLGQSEEYSRRKGGKKALVAANDNLKKIWGKLSA